MSSFLSPQWFNETNELLARSGPAPVTSEEPLRVVFEVDAAPHGVPHAFTISLGALGVRVDPGDHLAAHTVLRLSFDDARRITLGELDGSTALREGRVKLRGDVNELVQLLDWMVRAHPSEH
ncbi:MAG TPA: SCP2 sterol-binding domain-containing protein [Acidimicrobiales bacterium]|nr:SCP2 sterol-binding domain-containing protein [Acidimicrobiales bacterium]